jgi:hypothetical protein
MAEAVYYARFEAYLESFPAENYVDYMTNVMPVPEKHIFYLPSTHTGIICEVIKSGEARILQWRTEQFDEPPENAQPVDISYTRITSALTGLAKVQKPTTCPICEKKLGQFLRFF